MTSDEVIESYFRHGTGQNSRFVRANNESVAIPLQDADNMPHSTLYRAKRALVSVLLRLAAACGLFSRYGGGHDFRLQFIHCVHSQVLSYVFLSVIFIISVTIR